MEEEKIICPNCMSDEVIPIVNNEANSMSVITGNLRDPFCLYCTKCGHKFVTSKHSDEVQEIQLKRILTKCFVLFMYLFPLLLLLYVFVIELHK